jgi:hypothetical protein
VPRRQSSSDDGVIVRQPVVFVMAVEISIPMAGLSLYDVDSEWGDHNIASSADGFPQGRKQKKGT